MDLKTTIDDFTKRLHAIIEGHAMERARKAVMGAFGVSPRRGPGRPPKAAVARVAEKPRKRAPRQLCPVPGCKNPAAPIFGMVCAKHKDVAKSKIKAYREARRNEKLGTKAVPKRMTKRATKASGRRPKRPSRKKVALPRSAPTVTAAA